MPETNLTDLSFLRALTREYGIVPKKKYGQNFLINRMVPERIALAGCPDERDGVLEIGPGLGTLTYELCKRAAKVVALEIDASLLPVLEYTLSEFDNVKVIEKDIMKTDLAELCTQEFSECKHVRVCANLPYYITTPVLMYLLESGVNFKSITVMVQKEVADRITARAGSAEYGAITAAVGFYGQAKKLFTVSPGSFFPAPNVESCVLQIECYVHSPYENCDRELLFSLIRAAFEQRRKTLRNALKKVLLPGETEFLECKLEEMGFQADIRGEKLDISQYAELARALSLHRAGSPFSGQSGAEYC